jgi:hypothetical protein
MPFTNDGKAIMLNAMRNATTEISLHTADPGTTGASEYAGAGYARVAAVAADWDAPAAGVVTLNADKPFTGVALDPVSHFGVWAGATFVASATITGDTSFNAAGEFILKANSSFDLNVA